MGRTKILFFDSGVGGVTLLHKAIQRFPREDFIYYTDSANMPYGNQSKDDVLTYIMNSISEISKHELKALVISCHTIDAIGMDALKQYFKIPVIGVGQAKKFLDRDFDPRKVLVVGTPLMIRHVTPRQKVSGLQDQDIVDMLPLQKLVDFSEEFDFESPMVKRYLNDSLSKINWEEYHTLVIACSHMMFFIKHFRKIIPAEIHIIDGQQESLDLLAFQIQQETDNRPYELQCFLSGKEVATEVLGPYLNYLNTSGFFYPGNNSV
ncbi:MAG: glutamate racemase [Saprospiraceae bacterium]|jgi:glutamate racemase